MNNKQIKDMEFYEACSYVLRTHAETFKECESRLKDLRKFHSAEAHQRIVSVFEAGGVEEIRKVDIFCNVDYVYINHHDHRKLGWQPKFIFENDLVKSYGTFMMPVGNSSIELNWVFTATVFDENMEPYPVLCCNGFRTFKSGR
jgi:hypothetical protein